MSLPFAVSCINNGFVAHYESETYLNATPMENIVASPRVNATA